MEKACGICKQIKPLTLEHFATRNRGDGWQSNCRPCQKEYRRKHYLANAEKYKAKAKQWDKINRAETQDKVYRYLLDHPCVDCGETDPIVLQFDHLGDKSFNISNAVTQARCGWSLVEKEINKCVVRCANCHLRKTAKDFGYWKTLRV